MMILRIEATSDKIFDDIMKLLTEHNFKIIINNKSGKCFYIKPMEAWISHWTEDNPILKIDELNYLWIKKLIMDYFTNFVTDEYYNKDELKHIATNYAIHSLHGYEWSFEHWFDRLHIDWRKIANRKE